MGTIINRDMSWLEFNLRVLQEAADKSVPLYERIKFLSIFSSNLDEFFRVRYPYVTTLSKLNKKIKKRANISEQEDIAAEIQTEINRQLDQFGEILEQQIIPELLNNRIVFYYKTPPREEHLPEIKDIFLSHILSFVQPLFLSTDNNTRFIPENSKLYLFVCLKDKEPGTLKHAIVNIPSDKLKRFFVLSQIEGNEHVIFIDDIIRINLPFLFPGSEIQGVYTIKFNRDSEIHLDHEFGGDVLLKIEKELKKRDLGAPSRFLYESTMPRNVQFLIAGLFNLNFDEMFAGGHYHQLSDLSSFPKFDKRLSYPKQKKLTPPALRDTADIFHLLHTRDILLHLPYHSYNPVLSFFNQAAVDTGVKEIFITLYRVAEESHIINALISAARNGKKVTAFIELKARFDEYNNIRWSKEMKKAGINIIYSLPNIKVHSKIAVIKKHIGAQELSYAMLSTGNFNEITAQFYTDHVLMTTHPGIVHELTVLFEILERNNTDKAKPKHSFEKLLISGFNMKEQFEKLIENEIAKTLAGRQGLIRIKLNNLEEPNLINALYRAGAAGVTVQLLVRSICCMRPAQGVEIKRLVDRYLEHSRLFIFGDDAHAEVIMGSADWMNRNIHHRIEVCTPILSPQCKKELIDYFDIQWNDEIKTSRIGDMPEMPTGLNGHSQTVPAQEMIYAYLQNKS